MARSYATPSLVSLPHLSASNAITLSTRLVTVANAHRERLPPLLAKGAGRLDGSVEALRTSRKLSHEVATLDASAAGAADAKVDAACAGFHGFLQGWARLPSGGEGGEKAEIARALLDALYPQGLGFTQAPFVTEWAEVQRLLDRAAATQNVERIKALGGETFVGAIREAFGAYGEALQITKLRAEAKASVSVREPLDALIAALRSYVLRVTAHADACGDEGDAEGRALCEALLAPLVVWQAGGARKGKAIEEPAEGPEPEPASE